jgi:hypothetical protein
METSARTRQIGSATYRIALTGEFDTAPRVQARPARGRMRSLRERHGEISVACPGSIRKISEITGLDRVLTIVEAPAVAAETIA